MGVEFRDKNYVALLQGSEMLLGWHFRNLILGINCCSIIALTTNQWSNGWYERFQSLWCQFVSREGRVYSSFLILML